MQILYVVSLIRSLLSKCLLIQHLLFVTKATGAMNNLNNGFLLLLLTLY